MTWLREEARPLSTVAPGTGGADLEAIRDLVGDARVVVLGESTHGTREFTLLKHRIFRFLVTEMGFDTFLLEASWPESLLVDRWVAGGEGRGPEVLSRLYRWFLNTDERLELIRWIRDENAARTPGERLRFRGMDVQYPRLALDTVLAFLDRVDPEGANAAREAYACFEPYVNDTEGRFDLYFQYTELPGATKARCREASLGIHRLLEERRGDYLERASEEAWSRAFWSARLVFQNQHIRVNSVADQDTRDMYLAENILWEIERAGSGSKVVVSVHNYHAADELEPWPGTASYLRDELGDDLLLVALTTHRGSFSALDPEASRVGPHPLPTPAPGSYEAFFASAGPSVFFLDLRRLDAAPPEVRRWVTGPRPLHFIGSHFQEGRSYVELTALPLEFDAVIQVEQSTPVSPRPFVFP